MDWDSFPKTLRILQEGQAASHHSGAQFFVHHMGKGEVVLDAAWGEALEGVPMRTDTLMTWLSASKPVAAIGIARLIEEGKIGLDQPVVELIPAFAQGGKEAITVLHLLTHTGGFRSADAMWNRATWEENVARACAAPLEPNWIPGETAGYQRSSSWFILGEILRQKTGRPFDQWAREEIFLPLGMENCWFATPPEIYNAYKAEGRIGWLHNTAEGRGEPHRFWDTEEGYTLCWPGASGHGPIRELARLYEMFAGNGTHPERSIQILKPETVEMMTRRWRINRFDLTFQNIIDYGLGLIINSNRYTPHILPYGYGPYSSEETFGHSGAQSSCAFYDPGHQLVVAWVVNGMAGEIVHRKRSSALNAALYEDLGLAARS